MSYRIQNYVSEFQPHSPNDYKLQVFHSYMTEITPGSSLDLYFSRTKVTNLTEIENTAITKYDPLLNRRKPASNNARMALRDAFSLYYRSSFEALLNKNS